MSFENVISTVDTQIAMCEKANSMHEGEIALHEEDIRIAKRSIDENNALLKELRGARKLLDAAFDAQLKGPIPGTDFVERVGEPIPRESEFRPFARELADAPVIAESLEPVAKGLDE